MAAVGWFFAPCCAIGTKEIEMREATSCLWCNQGNQPFHRLQDGRWIQPCTAQAGSGEPPQPRCPKCGEAKLSKALVELGQEVGTYEMHIACSNCQAVYEIVGREQFDLRDLAQFFDPSAPQPARPPKQRDADLIVPPKPPRLADAVKFSHTAESLGSELWDQWFCRAMTSKETWMKHVMPILDKYFPSAPSGSAGQEPEEFDPPCKCAIRNSRLKQGVIGPHHEYSCPQYGGVRPENEPQRMARRVESEGRAESAVDYESAIKNIEAADVHAQHGPVVSASPAFQHGICPHCGADRSGPSAEAHDEGCPEAAAQPVANPKVEELSGKLYCELAYCGLPMEEWLGKANSILGPLFTQVSQPPTEDILEIMSDINAIQQVQNYLLRQDGKSHHGYFAPGGWAYERLTHIMNKLKTAPAAPVTPVSANGTEPSDIIKTALANILGACNCSEEQMEEAILYIAKEAETAQKSLAGAASHNGQGWVRVGDRLPEFNKVVLAYCVNACETFFMEAMSCGEYEGKIEWFEQDGDFWGGTVTHWQPLPAPPSEANGPLTNGKKVYIDK